MIFTPKSYVYVNYKGKRKRYIEKRESFSAKQKRIRKSIRKKRMNKNKKSTLSHRILNVMNDPRLKRFVDITTNIVDSYNMFVEKPTSWNLMRGSIKLCSSLMESSQLYSCVEFFELNDDWTSTLTTEFSQLILDVIKKYPYTTIKTSSKSQVIRVVNVNGASAGYIANNDGSFCGPRIYVKKSEGNVIADTIHNELWKKFKHDSVIVRKNSFRRMTSNHEDTITFTVDEKFKSIPTKRSDDYAKLLQRYIEKGIKRSVLLYGPPGTGKSTMARTLIQSLKLRSFRVPVKDMASMSPDLLFNAIEIFKPSAIIFDDFDRAPDQAVLLELLEYFPDDIKLVIATVNNRDRLDEAIMRPERFDELLEINEMPVELVKQILGNSDADQLEIVKHWPIAFINEYMKRRTVMSKTEAHDSLAELTERVARLESQKKEDSVDWKILGKLINNQFDEDEDEADDE